MCILQGPVAVKYSTVKDEPIKDLLGNITSELIQRLLEQCYGGNSTEVPTIDYLAPEVDHVSVPNSVEVQKSSTSITYKVGTILPDTFQWLNVLSSAESGWLKALLTSATIVQGGAYIDNPLRRALRPRVGQRAVVGLDASSPVSLTVHGAARASGTHKDDFKAIEVRYSSVSQLIDVFMYEERLGVSVPLLLQFKYVPGMGSMPIHEVSDSRNHRIKEFYWKLWFGDDESLPEINVHETFIGPEITISAHRVETFCGVIGNQNESYKAARTDSVKAPMDFAIVTGWQVSVHILALRISVTRYLGNHKGNFPSGH